MLYGNDRYNSMFYHEKVDFRSRLSLKIKKEGRKRRLFPFLFTSEGGLVSELSPDTNWSKVNVINTRIQIADKVCSFAAPRRFLQPSNNGMTDTARSDRTLQPDSRHKNATEITDHYPMIVRKISRCRIVSGRERELMPTRIKTSYPSLVVKVSRPWFIFDKISFGNILKT